MNWQDLVWSKNGLWCPVYNVPMVSVASIDRLVREAKIVQARRELEKLMRSGSLRGLNAARVANLFWRVGLPSRGLRFISSRLRGSAPDILKRHPMEAAEYAACLLKLGAFQEAKWLLGTPEVSEVPQALLYLGFAHLETWDYSEAIPCFAAYVKQPSLRDYARLVGLANLASSLVYERRHTSARPILRRLLHDSHVSRNIFLLGYVLEATAADRLLSGETTLAARFLDDAEARWPQVQGLDRFFLRKWRALLGLKQRVDEASLGAVETIRAEASSIGHWETARDCDRYIALATQNAARCLRLFFGTPYPSFRDRLLKDFGPIEIPATGLIDFGCPKPTHINAVLTNADEQLRRGLSGQSLALFGLLSSDSYRPHRLATLFSRMFPDEHYQTFSTAKRIHESIRRLGSWFRGQKIPLEVTSVGGAYRLVSHGDFAIRVPSPGEEGRPWRPLLTRIEAVFGLSPFATGEAAGKLGLPRRTLIRQLQNLMASGGIEKTGTGASTRYCLKKRGTSAKRKNQGD